jgi:hypothetical protein
MVESLPACVNVRPDAARWDQTHRDRVRSPACPHAQHRDLTHHCMTWLSTTMHPIRSSKVPEMVFSDRTRPIKRDRTHTALVPPQPHSIACVSVHHNWLDAPPMSLVSNSFRVQSTRSRPCHWATTLPNVQDRCSILHPVSSNELPNFTIFATLDQICQPLSVPPCAHVLVYFHKHFQGC